MKSCGSFVRLFAVLLLTSMLLGVSGCSRSNPDPEFIPGIYVNEKNDQEWIELYSGATAPSSRLRGTFYQHKDKQIGFYYGEYVVRWGTTRLFLHWGNGTADEFILKDGKIEDVNDVFHTHSNLGKYWIRK